ncbi:hypothetical protein [Pedobacter nyackensis]|uniref:Uncharacterized protein n=1 Tax=Pedobacter nyackensis TaxID=475255 RepID=A0A1W1ZVM9_9SPHI|nr:hypothetical protein [Pedobacter nyackensis]SMC52416.1 hypothetical protein SAMN04488101_10183 [Pedobacter nyackensis]
MPKVKQIIELWDTDRIGNDVVFHYLTPELSENDKPHQIRVDEEALIRFIVDFELADYSDLAGHLLQDAWEDIKDRYWADILKQQLETSYKEAMTYIQVYTAHTTLPMPKYQYRALLAHIAHVFGINLSRRAA